MAGGLQLVSKILFPVTVVMLSEAKHLSESLLAERFREPKRDPSLRSEVVNLFGLHLLL